MDNAIFCSASGFVNLTELHLTQGKLLKYNKYSAWLRNFR